MKKYIVLRKSKHVNDLDIVTVEEAENPFALELKLKRELKRNHHVLGVEYMPLKSFLKGRLLCGTWVGAACLEKIKEETKMKAEIERELAEKNEILRILKKYVKRIVESPEKLHEPDIYIVVTPKEGEEYKAVMKWLEEEE